MFKSLTEDPKNELLADRLTRLIDDIRRLELSTREEYQAEVYSRVNAILAMGVDMTPLSPITAEGPAKLGDLIDNLDRLNRDGADIASQILRIEDIASRLYNLSAASQNSLRQQIREMALASNSQRYLEPFITTTGLDKYSASVDQNAGVVSLPLISEEEVDLEGAISIGDNSIGTATTGVDALTDDRLETALVWKGTKLELLISFDNPKIINRLKIEMDDYQGLEVVTLETSPDGTLVEDILQDLGVDTIHMNGIQSKYSGDFVLDFTPRHCKTLRLVLEDRVDIENIALRSLQIFTRKYASAGRLTTKKIERPTGTVKFTCTQKAEDPFTSVTHQISYNGVHFSVIKPGDEITLTSTPFWYSAVLDRSSSRFDDEDTPVEPTKADPLESVAYVLSTSNSVPLGDGVIERTLFFQSITGPVTFRETPLEGTLRVQEGSVLLPEDTYAFADNVLSFSGDRGSVTVSYQTSSLGQAAIKQRQDYYTPLLYEVRFEKV